jgi:phosphoribosyl 1,2-cyclic phosphodiesterase
MKLAMLGSGSRGNATYVEVEGTRVLVDAGFSGRQVVERLARIGVDAGSLDALIVTHEHGDHTRGVGILARKFDLPVYLSAGTRAACAHLFRGRETLVETPPGRPFQVGALRVDPFLTVHDAADPVAVTLTSATCGTRVGVATDLGRPTAGIRHALRGCHFLVLEANHDETLLRTGPYPPAVQARIASSHGHLSNHAAARFLVELLHPELAGVLLAHLSSECNAPDRALAVVGGALRQAAWSGWLGVAAQDEPTELLDVARLRRAAGNAGQLSLL